MPLVSYLDQSYTYNSLKQIIYAYYEPAEGRAACKLQFGAHSAFLTVLYV